MTGAAAERRSPSPAALDLMVFSAVPYTKIQTVALAPLSSDKRLTCITSGFHVIDHIIVFPEAELHFLFGAVVSHIQAGGPDGAVIPRRRFIRDEL